MKNNLTIKERLHNASVKIIENNITVFDEVQIIEASLLSDGTYGIGFTGKPRQPTPDELFDLREQQRDMEIEDARANEEKKTIIDDFYPENDSYEY